MKLTPARLVAAAALLAALVVIGLSAILHRVWWIPNQKLRDSDWMASASEEEILATAYQVLDFPFGNHHDAFLMVRDRGGPEAVPHLLSALRWQPHTGPAGEMICTKAHCLEALRKITGADAGSNYQDWARWWQAAGRKVPASAPASNP